MNLLTTLLATLLLPLVSATTTNPQQQQQQQKKRPCTPSEIALATGIHLNIQAQYTEYNSTIAVILTEQSQIGNHTAFSLAKGALQAAIQTGMNLRLFNQQIAPKDSPATKGLETYAEKQEGEKAQVDGLTGVLEGDREVLEMLKTEIRGGIQLNEGNLKDAMSLCDFELEFPVADEMGS